MAASRPAASKSGVGSRTVARSVRQPPQVVRRRADERIAAAELVVEKAERLVPGERGQPERETCELHGDGIRVDARETATGDEPPDGGARIGIEVGLGASSFIDERAFVRIGQKSAGRDQEGAAAHRRIDDAQREDVVRRRSMNERRERPADHEFGQRLGRVERAGFFAPPAVRAARGFRWNARRGIRQIARVEIEHALVNSAELLDAEIRV